jgi:lysozyme family protein
MDANFADALKRVLVHEGGYVNHPSDPGGPTNLGITLASHRAYVNKSGSVADLKQISIQEAGIVYRARYWNEIDGSNLPNGVDYCLFDYAVNSGVGRARKVIRALMGLNAKASAVEVKAALAKRHPDEVVGAICDERMRFLKRLGTFGTFGKGWTARVAGVRRAATAMALKKVSTTPGDTPPQAEAKPIPFPQAKGEVVAGKAAQGTTVGGAAAGGVVAANAGGMSAGRIAIIVAVTILVAVIGVTFWRWRAARAQLAVTAPPVPPAALEPSIVS